MKDVCREDERKFIKREQQILSVRENKGYGVVNISDGF